ncbi:ATP-binding protein [Streptomyces sp. NPDC042319]|uniref:ATP-binding protein n=1 Tax=Streptomyces sp. NPDC042319 TaxID=3154332 RepID=UPI003410C207
MDPASTLLADVFTSALNEGLSRATATRVRPLGAVPDEAAAPRRDHRSGGPAADPADAALHRFAVLLRSRAGRLPGAPPEDGAIRALLALARQALDRGAGRPARQRPVLSAVPDAGAPEPSAAPAAAGLPPDQLLAAATLLTECLLTQGMSPEATAPLLRAVRESFADAAGPCPRAVDAWQGRRELARDVHDRLVTPLATALDHLRARTGTAPGSERLSAAHRLIAQAAENGRDLVAGLHARTPVPRLREALEDFLRGLPDGPEVRWHLSGDETTLPELFRRELLLVLREALLNARTHAAAATVTVTVRTTRRWAHAQVCDDGRGFDVAHTLSARPAHGLRAMSERIESVGGRLAVTSRAGDGTRVDVHLPRYQAG